MYLGNPQYLTTCLKNRFVISSTVQSIGVAMKVLYLENLSTTTMIEPLYSDLGKLMMKSPW